MGSQVFWRRALSEPGWIAAVEPDGTAHTAGDLLARVNQLTHGLRERGLRPGDGLAVLVPNGIAALEVYLAALQSGWYLTPVNWHFTVPEIAFNVVDFPEPFEPRSAIMAPGSMDSETPRSARTAP